MLRGARRTRLRAVIGIAVVSAVVFTAGCGGAGSSSGQQASSLLTGGTPGGHPVRGGTLVFDRPVEPTSFDPLVGAGDNGSEWPMMQILDGVVRYLPGSLRPQPDLASSWTQSSDDRTFTFKIRQGVRFSDGTPLRTEDVKYTLDRIADPKQDPFFNFLTAAIERISTPAADEVRVQLKQAMPSFVDYLATGLGDVVPEATFKRLGAQKFGQHPIGTGPFMIKRWLHGQELDLVRNPYYWGKGADGKPYLDGVTFRMVPDGNTRVLDLRSGEAQAIEAVPFQQIDSLGQAPGIKVLLEAFNSANDVWLNNGKKPLSDVKVRRALVMATPRDAIAKTAFAGKVEVSNGVLPKLKYWSAAVKPLPYDIAAAKKLLAQSSARGRLALTIRIVGGDEESKVTATILQSTWQQIGVKVSVVQSDSGTFITKLFGGDYDVAVLPPGLLTNDTNTPDQLALNLQDGTSGTHANGTYYDSPLATRLVREATTTTDESVRAKLFLRLQELGISDAQLIPLSYLPARTGVSSSVRGFTTLPSGWWRLEQVYLQK
jgi:peptide/nickel transport system substrate-binding protein